MNEEMIFDIIDSIATQAKAVIGAHLQKQELVETLKQSAKDWDEVGESMSRMFRDLEEEVRKYVEKNHAGSGTKEGKLCVGDEIVFIGNGCAVKDKISRVLVETEMGYQVYLEDAFRSMDELVEHLKKNVHG